MLLGEQKNRKSSPSGSQLFQRQKGREMLFVEKTKLKCLSASSRTLKTTTLTITSSLQLRLGHSNHFQQGMTKRYLGGLSF